MPNFKMIVFSDPKPGQEDEYNHWYTNTHTHDVVAVPGIVSAQRFKVRKVVMGEVRHRYLAIYDLETDDPEAALDIVLQRSGTDAMIISDAIDAEGSAVAIVAPCAEVVHQLA